MEEELSVFSRDCEGTRELFDLSNGRRLVCGSKEYVDGFIGDLDIDFLVKVVLIDGFQIASYCRGETDVFGNSQLSS